MWWSSLVTVLSSEAGTVVFLAYASVAVSALSPRPMRAFVRLAWLCALAAVAPSLLWLWGDKVFEAWPEWSVRTARMASYSLAWGVGLALALWFTVRSLLVACAPIIAATIVFSVNVTLVPTAATGLMLDVAKTQGPIVWHTTCALAIWWAVRVERARRKGCGAVISCSRCSYPLTGLTSPDRCPECGATFAKAT